MLTCHVKGLATQSAIIWLFDGYKIARLKDDNVKWLERWPRKVHIFVIFCNYKYSLKLYSYMWHFSLNITFN